MEVREGLSAVHVRYQQTFAGVPVFAGNVTVSLTKGERLPPATLNRYRSRLQPRATVPTIDVAQAVALARAAIPVPANAPLRGQPAVERLYAEDGGGFVLAWQVLLPAFEPLGTWLMHLRADNGRVLLKEKVLDFAGGQGSTIVPCRLTPTILPTATRSTTRQPWHTFRRFQSGPVLQAPLRS